MTALRHLRASPLAALALLLPLAAPARAQDDAPAERKPAQGQPFLWVLEGHGKPVYLYGTMHLPDRRLLKLPKVVEEALNRADAVYGELDLTPKLQMELQPKLMLEGDKTLKDLLPAELYERVDRYLSKKGIPLAMLNKLKPWALSSQLQLLDYMQEMAMGLQALDQDLMNRARRAKKEVGGLEHPKEQLDVFESLPLEKQVEGLKQTMDELEKAAKEGRRVTEPMLKLYLEGDLEKLMKMMTDEMDKSKSGEEFVKLILTDRNVRMADRIEKMLKEHPTKSYFFLVGTAHWPGKQGMLELLAKKGYKVRRLTLADAGKLGGGSSAPGEAGKKESRWF